MAKLDTLTDIASLANTLSAKAALNDNFDKIEAAFDNTLSRDGSTPNQMEADIDLNSNDLLNVDRIDAAEYYRNGVPLEQSVAYADKRYQLFSGTGAETNFTLDQHPGSLGNLEISISGVMQRPGLDYNHSGTILIFTVAPPFGVDNILVRYDVAVPNTFGSADSILYTPPSTGLSGSIRQFLDFLWEPPGTSGGGDLIRFLQAGLGTTPRTMQEKAREIRHITDWDGVDPTGVLDSTVGIQTAINECVGKDLHWVPGGYKISAELEIVLGAVRMYCPIGTVEIRQATPDTDHIRVGDGTSPTRSATLETVIDGFIFVPFPGTTASSSGAMIRTEFAANLNVRNCVFYGHDGIAKKSWNALELDRCEDSRIVDCKVLNMRNNAISAYGAAGLANRTVDVRIEQLRSFNCDGDQIVFGPHSGGMFLTNWISLGVAAGASALFINADPSTEQGTNYFIVNPNIEMGLQAGSVGIFVNKGQAVDIQGGWIGGVAATGKGYHFAVGSSSSSIRDTRVDGGQNQIDGAAISVTNVEHSGFGTDTVGLTVTAGATGTMISGRFRQFTTFGIDLQGSPQSVVIGPVVFANNGTRDINGGDYAGGPSVVGVRSGLNPSLTAATTLPIDYGQQAYQVTGGATISAMTLLSPGFKVSVQAGSGGLTWNTGANLILKASPAAQPAFSLMEFTMIGGVWYETSRSF